MTIPRFRIKKLKGHPVPFRPWCIADREHPHWIGRAHSHPEALRIAADRVELDDDPDDYALTPDAVPAIPRIEHLRPSRRAWAPAGDRCTCLVNPRPFTHYGAVETGDALEHDPECPKHGGRPWHINAPCSVIPVMPAFLPIGMRTAVEVEAALAELSDSEKGDTIELARSTALSIAVAAAVVKGRRHA